MQVAFEVSSLYSLTYYRSVRSPRFDNNFDKMPVKSDINWDSIMKTALTLAPIGITGLKWYLFLNKNDQLEFYDVSTDVVCVLY